MIFRMQGNKVELIKYRVTHSDGVEQCINDEELQRVQALYPDGTVETLDQTEYEWINGKTFNSLDKVYECIELGFVPKTEIEILQETVDMLVLTALEVQKCLKH